MKGKTIDRILGALAAVLLVLFVLAIRDARGSESKYRDRQGAQDRVTLSRTSGRLYGAPIVR